MPTFPSMPELPRPRPIGRLERTIRPSPGHAMACPTMNAPFPNPPILLIYRPPISPSAHVSSSSRRSSSRPVVTHIQRREPWRLCLSPRFIFQGSRHPRGARLWRGGTLAGRLTALKSDERDVRGLRGPGRWTRLGCGRCVDCGVGGLGAVTRPLVRVGLGEG